MELNDLGSQGNLGPMRMIISCLLWYLKINIVKEHEHTAEILQLLKFITLVKCVFHEHKQGTATDFGSSVKNHRWPLSLL